MLETFRTLPFIFCIALAINLAQSNEQFKCQSLAPLLIHSAFSSTAVTGDSPENQAKREFLFNLAKFVEGLQGFPQNIIKLCLLIQDEALKLAFHTPPTQSQTPSSKIVNVVFPTDSTNLRHCQIIYIHPSWNGSTKKILSSIGHLPILSVGESADFNKTGGMVRLYFEDQQLKFEINLDLARKSNIQFSSQILKLAKITGGSQ